MSTDLQLHHELPNLRISAVKTEAPSDQMDDRRTAITRIKPEPDDGCADESCRTPTSKESRIPATPTCPPAPQKPKQLASCKRKHLNESQFFEVANTDEMDAFFRSTFPKRSCRCT